MTSQSILESFHVLSRASFDALELYSEFALMTPVLAKSLTSGDLELDMLWGSHWGPLRGASKNFPMLWFRRVL